jgi:hypothetical protein
MNRLLVENSTNIKSAGWEKDIFEVEFANGGVYRYLNVPVEAYKDFLMSPSKGKFLNTSIKTQFKFEKVVEKKEPVVEEKKEIPLVEVKREELVQKELPFVV